MMDSMRDGNENDNVSKLKTLRVMETKEANWKKSLQHLLKEAPITTTVAMTTRSGHSPIGVQRQG